MAVPGHKNSNPTKTAVPPGQVTSLNRLIIVPAAFAFRGEMEKQMLFAQLQKADESRHEITGVAAIEMPDTAGEIMDYEASKPHFVAWSERIKAASHGLSKGNIRDSHTSKAVGKVVDLIFDDAKKAVRIVAKILDAEAWSKVIEGVFTGFSIGGDYGRRWPDADNPHLTRYEAIPMEISLVDLPCIPGAVFEFVKSKGGSVKIALHKIKETENPMIEKITEILQSAGLSAEQVAALAEKLAALMQPAAEPEGDEPAAELEKETAPAALTADDVKTIVLDVLAELGIMSKVGDTMAMGAKIGLLEKSAADRDRKLAELQKSVTSDLARLAVAVEELTKRGASSGPVLREITGGDAAKMQQVDALRKSLVNITDPMARQAIQNEIAKLEISAVIGAQRKES